MRKRIGDYGNRIAATMSHRRIAGLSIVELMVAITIGLILLAALTRLFVSSRSTYTLEEGLARVQESGRFAMEFLAQDIRMAGYAGCSANLSGSAVTSMVANPTSATTFNPEGIAGYKYTCTSSCSGALTEWSPTLPSEYFPTGSVSALTSTDVIVIQRADTISTHLAGNSSPDNANIQVLNTASLLSSIQTGDILMVSDCDSADVFKVTNISSGGSGMQTVVHAVGADGNTDSHLSHSYDNSAEIMKLITRIYFIGRRSNSASNPPSLYRRALTTNGSLETEELVEGVEMMRLLYGEDTDATGDKVPNIYRSPSSVSNWRKVITVRVGLLVKTPSNVEQEADTRTYDLADTTVGPFNDKVRRRAFNSTVQVRNHY